MPPDQNSLILELLRDLKEDVRSDTVDLKEALIRMEAKFGAHAELDIERFTEIRDILMNWKGVAKVAIVLVPAGISLIIGTLIAWIQKHLF